MRLQNRLKKLRPLYLTDRLIGTDMLLTNQNPHFFQLNSMSCVLLRAHLSAVSRAFLHSIRILRGKAVCTYP